MEFSSPALADIIGRPIKICPTVFRIPTITTVVSSLSMRRKIELRITGFDLCMLFWCGPIINYPQRPQHGLSVGAHALKTAEESRSAGVNVY
ncbi:hypothetical protein KSP39_PZI011649 [Platanthera zijinensis]|uniref:Uncharacterized protein n=1 Tax=Platanthera zijinensis TaxID=2320716 RepID=A0AAP0G625_9ASPA